MLTLKQIKENTEAVIERLRKKQFEAREAITEVLNFDEIRRRLSAGARCQPLSSEGPR